MGSAFFLSGTLARTLQLDGEELPGSASAGTTTTARFDVSTIDCSGALSSDSPDPLPDRAGPLQGTNRDAAQGHSSSSAPLRS